MPLLLRRALAQLRGDPPESWAALEGNYSAAYPFPAVASYLSPLQREGAQGELRDMLMRLDRANLGKAWQRFNDGCAADDCDPGMTLLCALADALAPVQSFRTAELARMRSRVIKAAGELADAIAAVHAAGGHIADLLPTEQRAPDALLSTLRHIGSGAKSQPVFRIPRGSKRRRIALYVAHRLRPHAGVSGAAGIASIAAGAEITAKALRKPSAHVDPRGFRVKLRVVAKTGN